MTGGTGQKFEAATTVVAGVASLIATLLSIVYVIWLSQLAISHILQVPSVLMRHYPELGQYGFSCKHALHDGTMPRPVLLMLAA